MQGNFYRAFEDRFRGSRELIKQRLDVYMPFIDAVAGAEPDAVALDLGCGRGEWLELLKARGLSAHGVDLDDGMLEACRERALPAEKGDAIRHLENLAPNSHTIITAFHLAEHLPFEDLFRLVELAHQALRPGGLLILETPNPENTGVGAHSFYFDPTHVKPLPPPLLSFVCEYLGFEQTKIVRLQERPGMAEEQAPTLGEVLAGSSPDYSVVARKRTSGPVDTAWKQIVSRPYGIDPITLAGRFQSRLDQRNEQVASDQRSHEEQLRGANLTLKTFKEMLDAYEGRENALARAVDLLKLNQANTDKRLQCLQSDVAKLIVDLNELKEKSLGKRYTSNRVPWHNHLHRAAIALFVRSEDPMPVHFYRAIKSVTGSSEFSPDRPLVQTGKVNVPVKSLQQRAIAVRSELQRRKNIFQSLSQSGATDDSFASASELPFPTVASSGMSAPTQGDDRNRLSMCLPGWLRRLFRLNSP